MIKMATTCIALAVSALPMTAVAQGLPSGMLFFYTSGAVCPSGSSRIEDADGRLLLGTAQIGEIGKMNSGTPMKNATPYTHTHDVTFTFDVKTSSIKSESGKRDTGTDGNKTSSLITKPSDGDLPYTQYLVCEVN